MRTLQTLIVVLVGLLFSHPALAQRYLTEFVGTAQIATDTRVVAIQTALNFDLQQGQHLDGTFSYVEQEGLQIEEEVFSSDAFLLPENRCPNRISSPESLGFLRLLEHKFDDDIFSLYGNLSIDNDPGDIRLVTGRMKGPLAMLRPPVDALTFGRSRGTLTFESGEELTLTLGKQAEDGSLLGTLSDRDGKTIYDAVVTSGDTWLYVVGVADGAYLMARGRVEIDVDEGPIAADGDFSVLAGDGTVVDGGTFRLVLTP